MRPTSWCRQISLGVERCVDLARLGRELALAAVTPMDVFDFLDWLSTPRLRGKVVSLRSGRGAAASTMNQRIAAVRGLFEFAVITGHRDDNPVPAAGRSSGARAKRRGLLGHVSSGRPRTGGRLVREPSRLPESLDPAEVDEFFGDLLTYRDRAIVLAMLLGGLRAGEVRSLRLADVDVGLRRVRVMGKGGRERVVPVHRRFFVEVTHYLRRGAERFLECFEDLDAWMCRPTRARVEDTRRFDAWPFVSWCFAIGRLRADVDLFATRSAGCHYSTWARLHPNDVERTVAVGAQLGWGDNWINQVCVTALGLVCLTNSCGLEDLNEGVLETTRRHCLADYGGHGTWLRVPVGKLNTERSVPVDEPTLAAFDEWARHRSPSRPLEHPRTHRPVDFMWVINGRRMGSGRIRRNLELAANNAGIGHVTPTNSATHTPPLSSTAG